MALAQTPYGPPVPAHRLLWLCSSVPKKSEAGGKSRQGANTKIRIPIVLGRYLIARLAIMAGLNS